VLKNPKKKSHPKVAFSLEGISNVYLLAAAAGALAASAEALAAGAEASAAGAAAAASEAAEAAGAAASAGAATGVGATGASSGFLPQATRAVAAITAAKTSDLFI
jgi:hypothetical protein